MIGHRAVHAVDGFFCTAENIAAADNQTNLHAVVMHFFNLPGQTLDNLGRHSEVFVSHQPFARQLQQNSFIDWFHYLFQFMNSFPHINCFYSLVINKFQLLCRNYQSLHAHVTKIRLKIRYDAFNN